MPRKRPKCTRRRRTITADLHDFHFFFSHLISSRRARVWRRPPDVSQPKHTTNPCSESLYYYYTITDVTNLTTYVCILHFKSWNKSVTIVCCCQKPISPNRRGVVVNTLLFPEMYKITQKVSNRTRHLWPSPSSNPTTKKMFRFTTLLVCLDPFFFSPSICN